MMLTIFLPRPLQGRRSGRGCEERTIDAQTVFGMCKNDAACAPGRPLWIHDLGAEASQTSPSNGESWPLVHGLRIGGSCTSRSACFFITCIACLPTLSFQNRVSEDRPWLALVCRRNFEQARFSLDQEKSTHDPRKRHSFLAQSFTRLAS
jgi:hypothetical protein